MNYIECDFIIKPPKPATDILIAKLGEIGFESFEETAYGCKAYILKSDWSQTSVERIALIKWDFFTFEYSVNEIEQVNWNEEWEKNFDPIEVEGKCMVRAPFHNKTDVLYDIVIEPKMSFGTGHHETTFMMIQQLLRIDFTDKAVLDMGCGTAVLAILAEMKGARMIDAVDIDNWCYLNSLENAAKNNCEKISVYEGDILTIETKKYDVIIANINRNVLLNDIERYSTCLKQNGILLLSGFYESDQKIIEDECNRHMLKLSETIIKNNWVSLKFLN